MQLLEALRILEAATVECKVRSIETPKIREALDLLDSNCRPTWYVDEFRNHLAPRREFGPSLEGQQQNLRVNFAGIYRIVRRLLVAEVGRLRFRSNKTKDPTLGAKLDRLAGELAKLPERWEFSSPQGNSLKTGRSLGRIFNTSNRYDEDFYSWRSAR